MELPIMLLRRVPTPEERQRGNGWPRREGKGPKQGEICIYTESIKCSKIIVPATSHNSSKILAPARCW
jgi:hypothetical protein